MFVFVLAAVAAVLVGVALKGRATGAPSTPPAGPPGNAAPTAADTLTVAATTLASNLATMGAPACAGLLAQFQQSVGLPATGQYDSATARALAAFLAPDSVPPPDVP